MNYGNIAFTEHEQLEKNNENKDFVVTNCGFYKSQNTQTNFYMKDDNSDFMLLYLHKGSITLPREYNNEIVNEGSILIYKPNEIREYTFNKVPESERYFVYFKGKSAENILSQFNLLSNKFYHIGQINNLPDFFNSIIQDFKVHNFDNYIFRTTILLYILNTISTKLFSHKKTHMSPVQPAIEYIESHYSEKLSTKQYADMCKLSVPTFERKFKQATGRTLTDFYNYSIVEKAKILFRETNLNVGEITYEIGLSDQFYFSIIFKKYTGLSPINYKKQLIGETKNT